MIALYGSHEPTHLDVRGHVVLRCTDWGDLVRSAPAADLVIIRLPGLSESIVQSIRELQKVSPRTPVILVTRFDPNNAQHLAHVLVDAVVWEHVAAGELRQVVTDILRTRNVLFTLMEVVDEARELDPSCKHLVQVALQADPPLKTVKRWALVAGRTPRAIQKTWRRHIRHPTKPHEFLQAVRELRTTSGSDAVHDRHANDALDRILSCLGIKRPIGFGTDAYP